MEKKLKKYPTLLLTILLTGVVFSFAGVSYAREILYHDQAKISKRIPEADSYRVHLAQSNIIAEVAEAKIQKTSSVVLYL